MPRRGTRRTSGSRRWWGDVMSKAKKKQKRVSATIKRASRVISTRDEFEKVISLIDTARTRTMAAVNTALIDLYWQIGKHISERIASGSWGQGTVAEVAEFIRRQIPNARGFSASNLWRMRQFFDTYHHWGKLAALLRELSWTHNLLILGKCKREEEHEFYLRMAAEQKWTSRQLERQINGALFERVVLLFANTRTTGARIVPQCRNHLQGRLPPRVPGLAAEPFRKRLAPRPSRTAQAFSH